MAIATFSLPIDIPWQRIAFSPDMMDKVACDRELPLRWRSSVAIFEYEPPEDQQRVDGFLVSYLKVACTITGYQPYNPEIRIRERLARSGWTHADMTPDPEADAALNNLVDTYYACYGAMLEVVVAPSEAEGVQFKDYPYFADFDPKKRELYEQVTDTGEIMSRSLEDTGVRLGNTTLQSHEVRDNTSVGAELGVNVGVVHAGGSYNTQWGTTDVNQRATENVRTTDAARENRETLSHTTQLSQMYHQLNSYHLGTNRAAFFVQPRPHVVQSTDPDGTPRTFVDGPRQLEGIQEFMLVVVRPKDQERICVEAYLETAHRVAVYTPFGATTSREWIIDPVKVELVDPGPVSVVTVGGGGFDIHKKVTQTFPAPDGYVIDTSRGGDQGKHMGVLVTKDNRLPDKDHALDPVWDIQPDHVTVTVEVVGKYRLSTGYLKVGASHELTANIYLKKKQDDTAVSYDDTLIVTGRAVCACPLDIQNMLPYEKDLSVVFEKQLAQNEPLPGHNGKAMSIHDANRLGAQIHREMLQSLSSADRYPRGMVSFLDTQLVSGALAVRLRNADNALNPRLTDWAGIQENTLRRVTTYSPSITRMQLLQMPLARQVESFGLSFAEAVELRRALADLPEPVGPPSVPERPKTPMPDLTGLQLEEARATLLSAKLAFGDLAVVDSPLPNGVVTAQSPQSGTEVDPQARVKLQISSGLSVRLPDVRNLPLSDAMCQLREAGLKSEPTVDGAVRPDTVVRNMEPSPRAWVMPHSPVTLSMGSQSAGKEDHRR